MSVQIKKRALMYISSNLEKSLKTEKEVIFNKVLGLQSAN